MLRKLIVTGIIISSTALLSFLSQRPPGPAESVKTFYLQQAAQLEQQILNLQQLIPSGNEKKLQQQFLKMRSAYKLIEGITEYYFDFFAVKLNGPPIPFFEEEEADMGIQPPAGMQVIEGLLFPAYKTTSKKKLNETVENLLGDTRTMQKTKESFAFNDEYILMQ